MPVTLPCEDRKGASAGKRPPGRMGHTATALAQIMVVIGGRKNPTQPLNDVWLLDLHSVQWSPVTAKNGPSARFRHSAVGLQVRYPAAMPCTQVVHMFL